MTASQAQDAVGALPKSMVDRLQVVHAAARSLRTVSTTRKNAVLLTVSQGLATRQAELLAANDEDLAALPPTATSAFCDRLKLTAARLAAMQESLRQVAALADPVGEVVSERVLANGLITQRVRSPLGVIFLIFESRPNVAIESFSLAFKAGNALILKGGKESKATTAVLYHIVQEAVASEGLDPRLVWGLGFDEREFVPALLEQTRWIDVVIPRGGEQLIEFVQQHSLIPIIKNDRGLCHAYVDEDADLVMACTIVENAKTQRPGVCNALETLLVHEAVAAPFLQRLGPMLERHGVRWQACPRSLALLTGISGVSAATEKSWDTEYLDLILNCRVVKSFEEAVAHIDRHGSKHSEVIVTTTAATAARFQVEVDAAAVYWNASTRFTDGFELGLGGEIGISTQKLHVRGPVGLCELTSVRWVITGDGQIR